MAYRCKGKNEERAGDSDFCVVEIVLGGGVPDHVAAVLSVDNQWETLRYVKEYLDLFIANLIVARIESGSPSRQKSP